MIPFNTNTKNAYKSRMREIKAMANLYLAKSRVSKNVFNPNSTKEDHNTISSVDTENNLTISYTNDIGTSNAYLTYEISLEENTNYSFKLKYERTDTTINGAIGIRTSEGGGSWLSNIETINDTSGTKTLTFNSGSYTTGYIWFYVKNASSVQAVDTTFTFSEIMLNKGETSDYEEYGTMVYDYTLFPLTEENECKVLGFYINEKTDVYYTSLPYNTMDIEVDNEKGYFTDYDPDSIVRKLNNNCYVDLFLKIENGEYQKIMTMTFDKISYSDYHTAKLSFNSVNATLKDLLLRDKDKLFKTTNWTRNQFIDYLKNNYNIIMTIDSGGTSRALTSTSYKATSVENLVLMTGTNRYTIASALLTTNDYQNRLRYVHWKSTSQETILKDYQLEKPIIKRETTYQGVNYTYVDSSSYATTNEIYNNTISGTLSSIKETIIFRDNEYNLRDYITIDDITTTGGITLTLDTTNSNNKNSLMLIIEGNIGQEYTITINKENIRKKTNNVIIQNKYGIFTNNSKVLKIDETSPLYDGYYQAIMKEKNIRSYVEVKLMGLPYIEVGDTIEVQTDNANVLITISEIELEFGSGLIQTIKGYELGWDTLYPSNTLYPSDDLYPNTPLQ